MGPGLPIVLPIVEAQPIYLAGFLLSITSPDPLPSLTWTAKSSARKRRRCTPHGELAAVVCSRGPKMDFYVHSSVHLITESKRNRHVASAIDRTADAISPYVWGGC